MVRIIMAKSTPKSILVGMVAKKISSIISTDAKDFDSAFKQWKSNISEALDKYDWDAVVPDLKTKCCGDKPKAPKASLDKIAKINSVVPMDSKAVFVNPTAVRTKGEFEIKTTEQGTLLKRTPQTKSIAIKCPDGSKGVQVDEDSIGCQLDDTKKAKK